MRKLPRSLRFYVAASTFYAATIFLAVQYIYAFQLADSGILVARRDSGEVLASIQVVSFIVWIGISLIAAAVMHRLANALAGAKSAEEQREQELGSIFGLSASLAGPLELDDIGKRFLEAVRYSVRSDVTVALIVHDDVLEAFRVVGADGPHASDFADQVYSAASLPAPIRTRVIDHRRSLVIPDTTASSEQWAKIAADLPRLAGARSFAALPLTSRDRLVGVLFLRGDQPGALVADRLQGAMTMGQYVAGSIHSALSVSEAEARADREAIVNRVSQRARASLDPDEILRGTVQELAGALGVSRAVVALGESEDDLRVAYQWTETDVPTVQSGTRQIPIARLAVRLGRTIVVSDTREDPRFADPDVRADLIRRDVRASVATPIRIGGYLAGALAFAQVGRPRDWTAEEVRLIESVARELRVAIEAARLYQARQRESERLLALHRASAVLAAQTQPRVIIDEILKNAVELLGSGSASLYRWDPEAGVLRRELNWRVRDEQVSVTLRPGESTAGVAFERMEPVVVNDYPAWEHATEVARAGGLRATIAVPLVRSGSPLGALVVRSYDPDARFTDEDGRLLTLFGDQVVAALTAADAFEQQRRAMEELERLNRAKSDFVSIVSHEFRTPLTGIQGFSEMMRDEPLTVDEMKEYAGDINKDAQRLNRMINEMLDLDKMESGRMRLHREPVELNHLIEEVADRVRPNSPLHPIALKLDPELGSVSADRDRITQVFTNLLSNAVKYSPTGGEIVVTSRLEGDVAHVLVRDRGMGIPGDALESIFERYGRIESRATRYIQGTGLGLPIVRQIMTMHGGQVWAESTVGEGSLFHVTLPLAEVLAVTPGGLGGQRPPNA
ncbi:MAG: hypothetical protein AUI58_00690 [Chloroflexi bacterium 13_1_40CM_2_70_6]|nr:MAG: hypothetical protein AUI58_00690 [Chloroflexi bacterium 13_1_40CM_2_70_6]